MSPPISTYFCVTLSEPPSPLRMDPKAEIRIRKRSNKSVCFSRKLSSVCNALTEWVHCTNCIRQWSHYIRVLSHIFTRVLTCSQSLRNGYRALFFLIITNLEERSRSLQQRLMHDDTLVAHIYQLYVRRKNDTANRMLNTPAVIYIAS
jgi:hypothetical protein